MKVVKTCCCTLVVTLCVVVQGAEKATVPQQAGKNWTQMSPYALVDSLYCPGQKAAGDLAAFTCEIEESHFRGVRAALRVFDSTL